MRSSFWLAAIAPVVLGGCGSQRNTGQALVYAGATAVAVGASEASATRCIGSGCFPQSPRAKAGAAVAATGLGVAAAGYALIEAADGDRSARQSAIAIDPARPDDPKPAPPPSCCRLVRKGTTLPGDEE